MDDELLMAYFKGEVSDEEAPDKHGCMVGRRFATGDARQECHQ